MKRPDFINISEVICKIFKHEIRETYFASASKKGKTHSGKIFDSYNNTRKKLRDAGIANRRSYTLT